jgi:hypothetical protein
VFFELFFIPQRGWNLPMCDGHRQPPRNYFSCLPVFSVPFSVQG